MNCEQQPSLAQLSARIVALLRGELHAAPSGNAATATATATATAAATAAAERERAFAAQEEHTARKLLLVQRYRAELALSPEVVSFSAVLDAAWLAPGVRSLLLGAGPGTGSNTATASATAAATASASASASFEAAARSVVKEVSPGVFAFDLFTPAFCDTLAAEAERWERSPLPRRRPNTMNNYGLVVNETGWLALMDEVLARVVRPLARACFPAERICRVGAGLDCHHSFVVQYRAAATAAAAAAAGGAGPVPVPGPGPGPAAGDEGLDMHHDASEVTLNVCLGKGDFRYAGLFFCGHAGSSDVRRLQYSHVQPKGQAVLHLGRHRHGAGKITQGERLNLILWARNSVFRAAAAAALLPPDGWPRREEDAASVDRVCLSAANDSDYAAKLAAFGP